MESSRSVLVILAICVCFVTHDSLAFGDRRVTTQLNTLKQEIIYVHNDISELVETVEALSKTVEKTQCCSKDNKKKQDYNAVESHDVVSDEKQRKQIDELRLKYGRLLNAFLVEKSLNRQLQQRLDTLNEDIAGLFDDVARNMTLLKSSMGTEIDKKIKNVGNEIQDINKKVGKMSEDIDSVDESHRTLAKTVKTLSDAVGEVSGVRKSSYKSLESRISGRFTDVVNDMTALNKSIIDIQKQCAKVAESVPEKVDAINDKEELGVGNKNMPSKQEKVDDLDEKDRPIAGDLPIVDDWIIIMRRSDGSENFYRSWSDYKKGFGNKEGEFWAGNDIIHELTKSKHTQLRIDMTAYDGDKAYAQYEHFEIGPEDDKYRLKVSDYSGTAGDSLIETGQSGGVHNGHQFSTFDSDNDDASGNCADMYTGAWWFDNCYRSLLTGLYRPTGITKSYKGVIWYAWKEFTSSLMFVEMKIRNV